MAGVIGLGCSSPADDDNDGTMKPVPTAQPPYINQSQTPAPATNNMQVNNLQPTTNNETANPQQVAPGSGGSGGVATGAAGAGGAPSTGGPIPVGAPGTGFNLTPVQGWVAGSTNEAGIQGAFSTISDATGTPPGSTTITPANFQSATGSQICVSGSASQVVGEAYSQYWGGGVAFDLGDPGQMLPKVPWNRGKVVGFSFNITGNTIPPMGQFRFGVAPYEGSTINDNGPCVNITMGANTIMFSQLHSECYNPAPGAALPDTAMLASLKWQVATVVAAPTPFNFCIENLKAIVQ
ncbi:MAG TPA: hypothetical protein VFS67_22590 [Polyangiaceae bacterium]|nr:hypothetical protein [Polyangiaceae bacterium]